MGQSTRWLIFMVLKGRIEAECHVSKKYIPADDKCMHQYWQAAKSESHENNREITGFTVQRTKHTL